ncbi:MAG: response regulator transcription factor [Chloroflexota bacterium]|nr:response regulator transcription factor [Chloroflexota bacterium]
MKVLIVEDDVDLLDLTTYALRREGYTVIAAIDGQQGLQRWEAERPDIVLLDGNLPKLNGFEVCRRIRQEGRTPIIMLTARNQEEDVVRGLQLGADDYVTKPFSAKVLSARMKAVIARSRPDPYTHVASTVRAGDLVLDLQSHEVTKAGHLVQLTPLEFRILYMLAMNEGRVIPYSRLVEYAWGYDGGDSSLLKTHICHIRQKLKLEAGKPGAIRAIAGVGYSLTRADRS